MVKTNLGYTEMLEVKTGLHQGSDLTPLLFGRVTEELMKNERLRLPCEILNAHDLALNAESEKETKEMFQQWKSATEMEGLCDNIYKTKVMVSAEE